MKLNEKLVALRKEKGLSQLKLAEMMNVSRQAISRWEVGAAVPSSENLKYLSKLYNVSLDYLLHDDADLFERDPNQTSDITVETASAPIENAIPNMKSARKWMAAALILLISIAICISSLVGKGQPTVLIDDLPKEEVEISTGTGFDIDF